MVDFLIRGHLVRSAQKYIDRLDPKVNIHVPEDLPLPSIRELKRISGMVSRVNGLEETVSKMTDEELRAKTDEFRGRYFTEVKPSQDEVERLEGMIDKAESKEESNTLTNQLDKALADYKKVKQKTLKDLLPEAFAVVREAGKRVLNMRHFDVQIIGGIVLNDGSIAEMTTGEGKTLVATMPAYLNALSGEGVHVVTVNDYLAGRDREWMGPIYEFLGLTVGVIQHDMDPSRRQIEYGCDITYGTNNEFGFDYLRDNMVNYKEDMVQRPHHFAIVDEVDSILIDEARTPLIISGPAEESTDKYYRANDIMKHLKGRRVTEKDEIDAKYRNEDLTVGYDYMADEKNKSISLTEAGEEKAAKMFGVDNMHDMDTIEYRHHILQALKAKEFFKMDVDYVVRDGQVIIVDDFTGRLMPGRRWSDGLHQAVEAKEGIKIERENQTLATITFQNYFRLYEKLSGMTGTAYTEAKEFKEIYGLDCMVVPTNRRLQRINYPDSVYRSLREKYNAIVEEIDAHHAEGRPVLVGTISIEKSELISSLLKKKGISHQVLNAKYHEKEAHIIAQAGRHKAVTIATNMAGRGTDIVLGGNAEYLARTLLDSTLKEKGDDSPEARQQEELLAEFISQFRKQVSEEHEKVVGSGGLHVIGTERHESRRIDNQLRGRQGRQGDPGSSRFYVSLEDDLMRLFGSERIIGVMDKLGMEEGQVLEHPLLTRQIEGAQKRVEGQNFEVRKQLLDFDDVMNRQREVIYDLRRFVLESADVKKIILDSLEQLIEGVVERHLFSPRELEEEQWDIDGLEVFLNTRLDYDISLMKDKFKDMSQEQIKDHIWDDVRRYYDVREQEITSENMRQLEKMLLMHTIDTKWKDHLYAMDQLREGISLRSFAQRDPLIEYKREGFEMFQQMYGSIHQEVAEMIFRIQPASRPRQLRGVFSSLPQNLVHDGAQGLSEMASRPQPSAPQQGGDRQPAQSRTAPVRKEGPKVGRNEPCPCGSGKKYKKCCGR